MWTAVNHAIRIVVQQAIHIGLTVSAHRLDFINAAWTPYHAVEEASKRLMAAGFTHIAEKDAWNLKPGAQAAAAL